MECRAAGAQARTTAEPRPTQYPGADLAMRPEIGTQPQFRKKQAAKDLSLRFVAVPFPRMGRPERRRELRRMAPREIEKLPSCPDHEFPSARVFTYRRAKRPRRLPRICATRRSSSSGSASRSSTGPARPSGCPSTCRRCRCSCTSGCPPRRSSRRSRATRKSRDQQIDMFDLFGDPQHSDRRPGAEGLRAPRQVGQPDDPGRFAGGDELAAALRGAGRPGADDLHRPALRREVRHRTSSRSCASAT